MKKVFMVLGAVMALTLLAGCSMFRDEPEVSDVYLSEYEDDTSSSFETNQLGTVTPLNTEDFEDEVEPPERNKEYDLYTEKDKVLLNIQLDNPDDLPITRVTVDGTNYFVGDFYQETDGLISIELPFDEDEDSMQYEVEEILYLDEEAIHFDENPVVDVVRPLDIDPDSYDVTNFEVNEKRSTATSLDYQVDVPETLIEDELVMFEVFYRDDDEETIKSEFIDPENESATIDPLVPDNDYTFLLVMYVDDLDGSGFQAYPFYEDGSLDVNTDPVVDLELNERSHHEVEIDTIEDEALDVTLDEFELYYDDQQKEALSADSSVAFDELWSDTEYTALVTFEYVNHDGETTEGSHSMDFETPAYTLPEAGQESVSMDYHELSFEPSFSDPDEIADFDELRVELDGETLHTQDSLDKLSLDDLPAGRSFDIIMDYTYDLKDNKGEQEDQEVLTVDTLAYSKPEIDLDVETIDYHTLSFAVDFIDDDNVGDFKEIEVYHGDERVTSTESQSLEVTDLLADTDYEIHVHYDYDMQDGKGLVEDVEVFDVETEAYEEASVDLEKTETDKKGFTSDVVLDDPDDVATFDSVNIIKDDEVVETFDDPEFTVDSLLSNTTYEVEVVYTQDMKDGSDKETLSESFEIKTEALEEASLEITNERTFNDSAQMDYDLDDPDDTVVSMEYRLYESDEQIASENDFEKIELDDLKSLQDYALEVIYTYDLNDGDSEHQKTVDHSFKTPPNLEVTSIDEASESYYEFQDTVEVTFAVDNPDDMTLEKIHLNDGETASLSKIDEETYSFTYTVKDTDRSGENVLDLVSLEGTHEGDEYEIGIDEDKDFSFMKYEPLEVNELRILDTDEAPLYHGNPSDEIIVEIILDSNPLDLDVSGAELFLSHFGDKTIDDENISMSEDKERIYVKGLKLGIVSAEDSFATQLVELDALDYENDSIEATEEYYDHFTLSAVIENEELIDISTPEELKDMEIGKGYRLVDDIDLSGMNWEPNEEFSGYFDGNGHTVENMTIDRTYSSDFNSNTVFAGLFGSVSGGVINDLVVDDFSIDATVDPDDERKEIAISAGGAAASIRNAMMVNSESLNGSITVNSVSNHSVSAGGLIGNTGTWYVSLKDSASNTDVTVEESETATSVGGLVGEFSPGTKSGNIYRSYSEGTIASPKGNIGGLIGRTNTTLIHDVYSSSTLEAENSFAAGGLIGQSEAVTIEHGYTDNLLKGYSDDSDRYNQMIGRNTGGTFEHLFTTSTHEDDIDMSIINGTDNDFYEVYDATDDEESLSAILEIMKEEWDEDIWDFSHDLPKLK